MNTDSLSDAAKSLSRVFREIRDQVDLSNAASDAVSLADVVLSTSPASKDTLVAENLATVEKAYEQSVAAIANDERKKREAEAAGQNTVASHLGLPDPSSARLVQLQQRLHTAFRDLSSMVGPG